MQTILILDKRYFNFDKFDLFLKFNAEYPQKLFQP